MQMHKVKLQSNSYAYVQIHILIISLTDKQLANKNFPHSSNYLRAVNQVKKCLKKFETYQCSWAPFPPLKNKSLRAPIPPLQNKSVRATKQAPIEGEVL